MARAAAADQGHRFGGAWTEVKLDAIHYYLEFYTLVLKDKPTTQHPFEPWYIDAFAGSGFRRIDRSTGGLFEGEPLGEETVDIAGSVLRALDVHPPFKRLVFMNDRDSKIFSLFCLSNSSSSEALDLIRSGVKSVLKKFAGL